MKKVKIYQLNSKNEVARNLMFTSYRMAKKYTSIDLYNMVWEGEFPSTYELDDIFCTFNINHPKDFRGHSLSVSDVVEVDGKFYYCDSCGWALLDWNEPIEYKALAVDSYGNDHNVFVKAGNFVEATKKVYALGYRNVVQVVAL